MKHLRKQRLRLQLRHKEFDALSVEAQRAFTRPGSMNRRKSYSIKKYRGKGEAA